MKAALGRLARRGGLLLLGLALGCLAGEALATGWARLRAGTVSVDELLGRERHGGLAAEAGPPYRQSLLPHPYLANVHRQDWRGAPVNNIGLLSPQDMPLQRRPDRFTILVLGGSAAALFAQIHPDGQRPLQQLLQDRYDFGGRQVEVLNGADGGWKQPQQLILLSLYGEVVDAVISLEGYNEFQSLGGGRLEYPGIDYHRLNPLLRQGSRRLAASALSSALFDRARQSRLVRSSRLVYYADALLRRLLVDSVLPPPDVAEEPVSVETLFALPADWTQEQRVRFNLGQYEKYLRLLDGTAAALGLRRAFFLQPVPAVDKPLDDAELNVVGDLAYGPYYRQMVEELLRSCGEGVPLHSLLDAFRGVGEGIYADAVHCREDLPRHGSTGYCILAERIAAVLERDWQLRRKP